jgi:hypothetical protein
VLTELFGEPTPLMTDDDVSKNRVSHVWGLVPGGGGELPLGVPNRFLHMCTPGHHQEQKQCTLTYSLQQDLRSLHDNLSLTLTHPVLADVIAPEGGGPIGRRSHRTHTLTHLTNIVCAPCTLCECPVFLIYTSSKSMIEITHNSGTAADADAAAPCKYHLQ